MSNNLFQIAENMRNIEDLIDNPDIPQEVIAEALNGINLEFETKIDNIAYIMRKYTKEAEFLKEESDRLLSKKKSIESKITGLKQYIEGGMTLVNKTKIKTSLNSFSVVATKSVDIINEDNIPSEYKKIEEVCKIDKKTLLKDLKEGVCVEGAQIKETLGLRIR